MEVEAVVRAVEQAPSLEAACRNLGPAIELPGVLRWARRRVQTVHAALHALKGLLPDRFPCPATLAAFATCLGVLEVLVALRPIGEPFRRTCPPHSDFSPGIRGGAGAAVPATETGWTGPAGGGGVGLRLAGTGPALHGASPSCTIPIPIAVRASACFATG